MSLCPDYCECKPCRHGVATCQWCVDCRKEADRRAEQRTHLASVARQKMKLRVIDKGESECQKPAN